MRKLTWKSRRAVAVFVPIGMVFTVVMELLATRHPLPGNVNDFAAGLSGGLGISIMIGGLLLARRSLCMPQWAPVPASWRRRADDR